MRLYLACSSYAKVMHWSLILCTIFVITPVPSIKLCTISSYCLFHSCAQDLTLLTVRGELDYSSGICHLMPCRHLPEWREEDEYEWTLLHWGSSDLNHTINQTITQNKAIKKNKTILLVSVSGYNTG